MEKQSSQTRIEKQSSQGWNISKSGLRFLLIILLVISVFFRFANLDKKVYWGDETFSSLRISGYLQAEMNEQLSDGRVFTIQDLHKYQYPNAERDAGDTIKGIMVEDSQILPLYILMTRFWVEWFGDSVAVARSFSAFISLFTFPLLYLLCLELFESSLVGWMAIALIAVSPIHLVYAQEVRAYSLWIVTILMSSVALLRAMRLKTKVSWAIYAVTLSLGFYTHLFFALVAFAQGIYLIAIERFRLSKTSIYYLISSLAGLMSFVPWIWVIITYPQPEAASWASTKQTFLESGMRWAGLFSRPFLDLGVSPSTPGIVKITLIPFILIILTLIFYSIYFICRKTPKKVWLFVLTLIGSVGIPLLIADFIFQERYATSRYTLSSVLGIQVAIAYLLTTKIASINTKAWQNKLWSLITFILIMSGIVSSTLNSQAQMWWNKFPEKYEEFPKIANIVSQGSKPLLISSTANILPPVQILSYLLDPKVQYQIVGKNQLPKITSGFTDIFLFLFEPSDPLKTGIEKVYNSKLQQINQFLWKVTKST
ncbi:glycosyltransferase family 39 protein [Nostoc sp. UHCC 0252]|uniref:glycosyltransferase family 39 protein n=1 Tax=Nostoc sp. UHCC 0252 TaxID=3110241 RepID=UPI002B214C41|nr:glycosyltransferase family 39 protein [Nostoc sp. UHCC 0252]MEA5599561.1 glycosyltransferase family 39 protein [Nostoc sp. UHCC 0252]